jgi:hypothetical protein
MSQFNYFSFLLCFHSKVINVYYCGLPLGCVEDNLFQLHQFTNADGSKRKLTINDLPEPCPFGSLEEVINNIIITLQLIKQDINDENPKI